MIDSTGKIQQPLLQVMLDKAATTFAGRNSIVDAWRKFISSEDVIGLKINANSLMELLGTDFISHFSSMTSAIISGYKNAGIKDDRIVIWERSDEELKTAGFAVQHEPKDIEHHE